MRTVLQKAGRIVFIIYLLAIHSLLFYFVGERVLNNYTALDPGVTTAVTDPTERKPVPTPLPVPESFADPNDANSNVDSSQSPVATSGLMIPVMGVKPEELIDTFSDSRSEGRYHDAIDIAAPVGTPVIAAADGEIARFLDSERGGITIYQLTDDKKFMLYYAHLQRRADEISVGTRVKKGATIGYVGDTGNAGTGNYHLHFSIAIVSDPKQISGGTHINPFPHLKAGTYPQLPVAQ